MCKKLLDKLALLEKLSLIKVTQPEVVVEQLSEAIQFAQQIRRVDTRSVRPLYTVLEGHSLRMREDTSRAYAREEMQRNARKTLEGFFVVETEPGKRKKS